VPTPCSPSSSLLAGGSTVAAPSGFGLAAPALLPPPYLCYFSRLLLT
jgi:hypothetical protein